MSYYKRYVEKRNGKNVLPLRNAVCGIDMPKWELRTANYNEMFLSGEAVDRLAELEDKIENGTLVLPPKYKLKQKVYLIMGGNITSGIIDGFDFFKRKYLVFIDDINDYGRLGFGNEWFFEEELFLTKPKVLAKLRELKGE